MDPSFELRREPPADLTDVGEETALVARIREEIRARGPMPFARFMDLALYDPDGGYYRAATARPGPAGDFVTAPELHPIFGATLATGIAEIWERLGRPDPFTIRELGAGTGALALAILGAIEDPALRLAIRYRSVEVDPRRTAAFDERLRTAGFAEALQPDDGRPITGVILGNEVLDALPVHRVRGRADGLVEVAVGLADDGAFIDVETPPTTDRLAARLADEGITLLEGQAAEICLAVDDWIAAAVAPLARGIVLLIDYGAPATELYDPVRRRDGTLRAYLRQQVHGDPFQHVGRQDLTAHVDVTAVERAAAAAGLVTLGVTTQMEALAGLGIEARWMATRDDPTTSPETYTATRASLRRLLDPAALGRFRVMVFGRDWPPDAPTLGLLAFRIPDRRPTSTAAPIAPPHPAPDRSTPD